MEKDLTAIGREILETARNELYVNLPYLDAALCSLTFTPGNETQFVATDGQKLVYSGAYLSDRFLRSRTLVNRIYLHVILHCMLRHPWRRQGRDSALWDLSCDIAVESILDSLDYPCLRGSGALPLRQSLYGQLRRGMAVLTAEGIYLSLSRRTLSEYDQGRLSREFFADDHTLWDPPQGDEERKKQSQRWEDISQRTQTGLETVLAGTAQGGEAVYEQVKVANRESPDYRSFLRRFAAIRETAAVDGDAFEYGFYSYGLRLYGNMPLIEPPETREDRRIEDFVIAIDTSMSTSGALVRQFLSTTYSILKSTETFTRKMNLRILQCDDQLRSDRELHTLEELREYMEDFELAGGSATDFRPVFEHVARLQEQGALRRLRGLLYFTDGMGIYPKKRPPYDTAFILMEESAIDVPVPPWAIRMVLTAPDLERAAREEGVWEEDSLPPEDLPIL